MKNLVNKYGKKKVYGVAGGILVLIIALIVAICVVMSNQNKLVLNDESLVVELGEAVSMKPSAYLDEKVDRAIANDTVLKSDLLTNEDKFTLDEEKQTVVSKDKKYLEVGKYDAVLSYKKEELKITIEVKDTKAPVFKDILKEVVVEENAEDVDFTKFFQAKDLSEFKISVDDKEVDLSKTGDYKLKVIAKDKYNNEESKEIKVRVLSLEDAKKEDTVTKTLDGTVYQSKAMKEKIEEEQKVEEEKKHQEEIANNGGSTNNSGNNNTGGSANNGGNSNAGGGTPQAPAPTEPFYRTDIANSYVAQINAWRQQNGVPALAVTGEAQAEANMRAMQLVSNYAHNSSAGFGENIGMGDTGYNFFEAWKNSAGHNANMLRGARQNGVQTYDGFAVAVVEYNGKWYAVTSFHSTPW